MLKTTSARATIAAILIGLSISAPAIADSPQAVDIPAGELRQALLRVSEQFGTDLVFSPEHVKGLKTGGAHGQLTIAQAVTRLLEGTPLELRTDSSGAMLIAPLPASASPAAPAKTTVQSSSVIESSTTSSDKLEEIIVTGTNIRGTAPASPLIEITRAQIERSGFFSGSELISSVPQNYNGGAPQVPASAGFAREFSRFIGTSTPSLRGLGDGTLTLFDGYRLPRTGGSSGSDVSAIPLAAIERVDIITDGASSIYGSDAVAGVINFVPRRDFQGVQLDAGLNEPTRNGGGRQTSYSLVGGTAWSSGNALLSCGYRESQPLLTMERDFAELAPEGNSLSPDTKSTSCLTLLRQDLTDGLSFELSGMYGHREGSSAYEPSPLELYVSDVSADQYVVNSGLRYNTDAWEMRLSTSLAQDTERNQLSLDATDALQPLSLTSSRDRSYSAEVRADGPVASLPSGDVKVALGGGFRKEQYLLGLPLSPEFGVSGSRKIKYAFAEANVPLVATDPARDGLNSLVMSLALRHDDYDDFGGTTNPKVGFVYSPSPSLRLKGTFGESFRAPLLTNLHQAENGLLFLGNDPQFPGGVAPAIIRLAGNPDLKPETSDAWTATLDFSPMAVPGFAFTSTYFRYDFEDKILQPVIANFFADPLSSADIGPFTTFNPSPATVGSVAAGITGLINIAGPEYTLADVRAIIDNRYTNVSVWRARGFDVGAQYSRATVIGELDLSVNATRLAITQRQFDGSPETDLAGLVFNPPEWKMRSSVGWSRNGLNIAAYLNYVDGSEDAASGIEIGSFTTVDLQISYRLPRVGLAALRSTRLSLGAFNLFDRNPPRLPEELLVASAFAGYDSANASPFGRVLTARVVLDW